MNKQKTIIVAIFCAILVCLMTVLVPSKAAASTISGQCQVTVKNHVFGGTSSFNVVMPDGKTYTGYCQNPGWPTPLDGTYNFTGTLNNYGTYDIYVHSSYNTTDINQIHPLDRNHMLPDGKNYWITQAIGGFTYSVSGYLNLKKSSSNTSITNNNPSYSLANASYGVYTDSNCTNKVATLTTNANGDSNTVELSSGTYYVKEISAPKGFAIDTQVHNINVSSNNTSTVRVSDTPQTASIDIMLGKIDAETTDDLPQGDASLKDAEYTVKFYSGQYDTNPSATAKPTRTWVFKTDANGMIKFTDSYKVSGDSLYDSKHFPLGTLTIQETKAPKGYLINNEVIVKKISASGTGTTVTYNMPKTKEQVVRGDVEFFKMYGNPDDSPDTYQPEAGTVFSVVLKSTGEEVGRITTDENGHATTKDISSNLAGQLVYGTYTISEVVTPEGRKPIEPFDIEISENGVTIFGQFKNDMIIVSPISVVKTDKSTGKNIPIENTEFRILDKDKNPITITTYYPKKEEVSIFKTDENGQFTLPTRLEYGTYYLEEVNAPKGYLKGDLLEFKVEEYASFDNPLIVKYADENEMGKIVINKTDEETGEKISGTQYQIIAKGDIVTPDGTVRAKDGEIVDTLTTKNGTCESKELYLGTYNVVETKQTSGYIRSNETYEVSLEYADQTTTIVEKTLNLTNKPSVVVIEKTDEETNEPLSGVKFSMWKKGEDKKTEYVTDEKGNITVKYLAPGTYCVQETKSIPGYSIKSDVYELTISDDGRIDGNDIGKLEVGNIHIKMIGTTATDNVTKIHQGFASKETLITDTVKMSGLQVGKEYVIKATPMDVNSGEALGDPVEKTFTATAVDQDVQVTISIDTSKLKDHTINMFEEFYDEGVLVAEHKDLKDENQSVYYPDIKIGTTAKDNDTNVNVSKYGDKTTITDTVKYENLIVGFEYKMQGTIVDKDTGNVIEIDGEKIVAETTFTPTESNGSVDVVFTFNSNDLKGKNLVVFEKLFYTDFEVANHEDVNDEGQTIHIPNIKIGTTAKDSATNINISKYGDETTIIDTVKYTDITPGYEYTMKGKLVDKETGEPIIVDGKELTSEATFTPTESDGTVDMIFTFNSNDLKGKDLVAFEKLYLNEVEFATHEDVEDEGQTIHIPNIEIKTTAKDNDTNVNVSKYGDKTTITDTVKYTGLVPNVEYVMKGKLVDKETGEPIIVNEKEITAETTFTPEESDGTVDVVFELNSNDLKGKDLVVFEKLYLNEVEFANHEDVEDEGQTVHIPDIKIGTTAKDNETNLNITKYGKKTTIIDTVSYSGLTPGYEYVMKGSMVDKETGKTITIDDKEVIAETTFTPEKADGTVEVKFVFDSTDFKGKDLVVFEKLYLNKVEFASHEDITDEGQTVHIPAIEIKTNATNKADGGKTLDIKKDVVIVDKVSYKGLVPGKEATIKGVLMDKSTNEPVVIDNKQITATKTFTPEKADGTVELEFTVDTTNLASKELVVFEKLYYGNVEFASHEDINDKDQTVKVKTPEKHETQTGDNTKFMGLIFMFVACLSLTTIIFIKKRKY